MQPRSPFLSTIPILTLVLLLPMAALGAGGEPHASTEATGSLDISAYLAQRSPGDPDPRVHMRTLIAVAKQNRQAAIAYCAAQKPPIPPSACSGGVPFCALIVDRRTDEVVVTGCNHGAANPVFHGEITAINNFADVLQARGIPFSEVGPYHDLYTTGESCAMCMGAIMWSGFHTVFFGSDLDFLEQYYAQITISDQELAGLWRECQATENTVRTQVVGGVLQQENDALFEEFGFQFCSAPRAVESGAHAAHGH